MLNLSGRLFAPTTNAEGSQLGSGSTRNPPFSEILSFSPQKVHEDPPSPPKTSPDMEPCLGRGVSGPTKISEDALPPRRIRGAVSSGLPLAKALRCGTSRSSRSGMCRISWCPLRGQQMRVLYTKCEANRKGPAPKKTHT